MHRFYLLLECPNCGSEIFSGPVGTLLQHQGIPVIPYDIAAQEQFDCDECQTSILTGDFPLFVEEAKKY